MTLSPKNAKMIPVVKKEVFRLKTDWKKELPAAFLDFRAYLLYNYLWLK